MFFYGYGIGILRRHRRGEQEDIAWGFSNPILTGRLTEIITH